MRDERPTPTPQPRPPVARPQDPPPEPPERLSESELMESGANLDESLLEGEGPPPK